MHSVGSIAEFDSSIGTEQVDYSSAWQESMPDVAWGTVALFFGIMGGYAAVITAALTGALSYPIAAILCTYLCFASFTIMHDAGHGSIVKMGSKFKFVEDIMGWMASFALLVSPYRLFQKIHDRHHAFTNDPDRDPDHFTLGTKWYQILLNTYFIPFRYYVMAFTTFRHIKIFRDTYFSTFAYLAIVITALSFLIASGYLTEVITFMLVPVFFTVFILVMFFDYIPHHPHKSQDRYHNTRIFPSAVLNAVLLGQNYHLIHHMYPRLPWYKYKEVFHRILPDLEAHDAPIEDIGSGLRPGFMKSPNAKNLHSKGRSVHHLLEVDRVDRLTSNSVAVSFKLPEGESLKYQAGQYLTVSKWLGDEQQTRCYSLCASPSKGELKIGVRQTDNGLMSSFINQELRAGDELVVQGPFGDFTYPAAHGLSQDKLVLIAGGSGITPVLSILETALEQGVSSVHLVYACRSFESIMFYQHLEALKKNHPDRLVVTYFIDSDDLGGVGVAAKLNPGWLEEMFFKSIESADSHKDTDFYLCGPEGLKNMVVEKLGHHGVAANRIHVEQFVSQMSEPEGELHTIDIMLADGQKHQLCVASNQTVLEVAKSNDVTLPHACGNGTCGTCKFKVESGEAITLPDSIPGVTSDERAEGFTLACQCRPKTDISMLEIRN